MAYYKVRMGQAFGQNGIDVPAGAVVELDARMAHELRSKVDPCLPDGTLLTDPQAITEAQLASAREHERISLLEQYVGTCRAALDAAEQALDAERARQDQ